jgi:hypothetical protein
MRVPNLTFRIAVLAVVAVMAGAYAATVAGDERAEEDLIWLLPYESGPR